MAARDKKVSFVSRELHRLKSVLRESRGPQSALRTALLLGIVALSLTACRQDMQDQPKYKYLRSTEFFTDGRSARPLVENTVARGHLNEDTAFYTGMQRGPNGEPEPVTEFPTREVIDRGQERFNIYCSPCHGQLGNGLGMIVQRGFKQPPSYHIDRLRQIGVGHFYDVITNGYGAMWKYSAQIEPRDRWAIAAYIRVLQASQDTNINDLTAEERAKLPGQQAAHAVPAPPRIDAPTPVSETGGPQ